ncbi:DUF2004 domain-containing protein [Acinetobacter sp. VNK23]|uniref:DUF2004 domain-containing protein n=1 Tax=Acinetobacter thutiue TaxID=2998078 RepID=UPI0025770565|nr:DUF2004 domain-containing protein [Acinetobacter thutiue]MDM1019841.1 DUF2004 domain-containing protein [Acinetobacter thutiue]
MTEISLQQREKLARIAMRTELENQQAGESVELFIRHHLEEIEPEYWQEHFATATPTVLQVLDALILISQWGDNSEKLDFTLADDVTDYVICVSFDSKGQVIDISMES